MSRGLAMPLLLVILALFGAGLWHSFKLRFEAGDVYPAYSSLRADPLGTMAFFETLERTPGFSVFRDLNSQGRLPEGRNTVYLHIAGQRREWAALPEETFKEAEAFLLSGGRLVIAFSPEGGNLRSAFDLADEETKPVSPRAKPSRGKEKEARDKRQKRPPEREGESIGKISLKERWGIEMGVIPLLEGGDGTFEPAVVTLKSEAPLPETLPWHSSVVLTNTSAAWAPIYSRGRHPVLAERKFGKGTIVIATDSYFLSNEALRSEPESEVLSWIIGPARTAYFDEAHLGIAETPGVGGMIRNYRLHWLGFGLLALAALFIWKNSSSFHFPAAGESDPEHVQGKQVAAGFNNLLRRNLPARDLIETSFGEWEKSAPRRNTHAEARAARAREWISAQRGRPAREQDPVNNYREISKILYPPHKP